MKNVNNNPPKDVLYIKAFEEPILLEGKSYYDQHARAYSLIRLPSRIKELYPRFKKTKVKYKLHCFKDRNQILDFLEKSDSVPILLNLFSDKQN